MAQSLSPVDLTTEARSSCALAGCTKLAALHVLCKVCSNAPKADMTTDDHPGIAYCSEQHREQDVAAHKDTCQKRRTRRDAARLSRLQYLVFSVTREKMFEYSLLSDEHLTDGEVRFKFSTGLPADEFCKSSVDENIRLCALHLSQCVDSIHITRPLVAYMNKGARFRVTQRHLMVKPRLKVTAALANGVEFDIEDVLHSVLFLTPASQLAQRGLFADDGFILDPSAAQMGFFNETIAPAAEYMREKVDSTNKEAEEHPFGWPLRDRPHEPYVKAQIRVVCNILYPKLEQVGGDEGIYGMELEKLEKLEMELKGLLEEGLEKLRYEILAEARKSKTVKELEAREEELADAYEMEGYKAMVALVPQPPNQRD